MQKIILTLLFSLVMFTAHADHEIENRDAYGLARDQPTFWIQNVNTLPVVPSGWFLVFIASCSKGF